ncbi:MAG: murein biosynthesis integral membrane protein MurJ [bacterium]
MSLTDSVKQRSGFRRHRRAAGIVGLAVVGSRVLGLVRESVFAAMFGAGALLDAFLAAFQIPNLLRDMFAEGALSTAFTTVFTKTHEKDGSEPAWRLTSLLFSTIILLLGAISIVGIVISPVIVHITNFGFHQVPGKFQLTVDLTRMMFPFIIFVSIAAVLMGILNSRFVFGIPASASTVFNFVTIVAGIGLALLFDPQDSWRHPRFTENALYGLSLGVLLGGMAQAAMQLPTLFRLGFRFKWRIDFADPRLREVWALMWPGMIAAGTIQVNIMVNGMFASEINGARSWLNCAFRIVHFPIGIFGVAIATALLPAVARSHARRDMGGFGSSVEEGLRLTAFLTIPASVGLMVLAPDIVRLVYQHGHFSAIDTAQTASALRAYTLGLAAYASIRVLTPCFSALGKPRIPLRVSLLAIGMNIVLNLAMVEYLGMKQVGLALSTACLALINCAQLALYLRRYVALGRSPEWGRLALAVIPASLLAGLAAWGVVFAAGPLDTAGTLYSAAALALASLCGAMIYFGITLCFRLEESHAVAEAALSMIRKLSRK